jgi:bifunctional DNA-binding transcriptional regulator/antitoxin component of YhaV-PrlF toxin-antitoxin module
MFDATAARTVATADFEKTTNLFAAELEDRITGLTMTERQELMNNLLNVVRSNDTAKAFAEGTYSQAKANDGSNAKALGAGKTVEEESLEALLSSPLLEQGQKAALLRIVAKPGDPTRIKVETDGTPSEIKRLQAEVTSLTKERDDAKQELDNERDEAKPGSLAAKAKTGGAIPSDAVKKADVRSKAEEAKVALTKLRASKVNPSDRVIPETEADKAIKAIDTLVTLVK